MRNKIFVNSKRKAVSAAVVLLLALGLFLSRSENTQAAGSWVPAGPADAQARPIDRAALQAGFSGLVKQTAPAVVNIFSSKMVSNRQMQDNPFFSDPMFRRFFGEEFGPSIPRERRERGLGSGVIVNPNGYILTNNHVVEGAEEIQVMLNDKRQFKATIVGTDPKTDLAVLRVEGKDLPSLRLGDSAKSEVGDLVLAIGNPFGLGQTVTMGIISATGRGIGMERYEDFIQTDAAINPGNSGGALINTGGELIGINTAILSRSGGNQGVGFAIPSNMARHVMQQIEKHGKVVRGFLGVSIQPVTPEMAKAFGRAGEAYGALIAEVSPDSPAQKGGLEAGDIILELNGQRVEDSRSLSLAVANLPPGSNAKLKVFRNGSTRDLTVTLGELTDKAEAGAPGARQGEALAGVAVDDLSPSVARQLGVPPGLAGVVVTDVDPSSSAAEAGLRRGDVVREVNRKPVTSVAGFRNAVTQSGNQPVLLLVNRQGSNIFLVIESR